MDRSNIIECGGFYFIHNFDSGNLGHVERVSSESIVPGANHRSNASETPKYEFNIWTRPDCAGTEFENGNRTWFYFGIQASEPNVLVRLNLLNLNKQGKMYNQGMAPVTRTLPGKPQWERIRDRPVHSTDENSFTLSFKYRTSENVKATTFFAFTYPYSFAELQIALNSIDMKMLPMPQSPSPETIYYHRECLIYSLEGRRVDLLTISSHHGITSEREEKLKNLFPNNQPRPFKFLNKKIIFVSARVHPGETPSSFVFNGFLNLLLTKNDPIAMQLRELYVFKLVPFLNPDGVVRGHYRTDTRGVNLNRMYLNPSLTYHPTVYAARALIRYYHFGCEKEDKLDNHIDNQSFISSSIQNITGNAEPIDRSKKKRLSPIHLKSTEANRQEKKLMLNKAVPTKSCTSIKNQELNNLTTRETATLAEQVCELKLTRTSPPTDILKPKNEQNIASHSGNSSLLNDEVIKSCLGTVVRLSPSEELNALSQNPLRPLRDTLKNSISLLMDSNTSVPGDFGEGRTRCMKIGWCKTCLSIDPNRNDLTDESATVTENESTKDEDVVYFCTNCFKRYTTQSEDEANNSVVNNEIQLNTTLLTPDTSDNQSCDVSSGDTNVIPVVQPIVQPIVTNVPTEDTTQVQPKKELKTKSPVRQPKKKIFPHPIAGKLTSKEPESGLYLYLDLHGHASKKGIFMYGNYFEEADRAAECMLLPRLMALNNVHFHFSSCNFTERNMYLKDRRDGMSREGSGRVAVLKATGLTRSYTLECNYNTGRLVNVLPPTARDSGGVSHSSTPPAPPKYTPGIYEEVRSVNRQKNYLEVSKEIDPFQVGKSMGAAILDLTGQHPNSRLPGSEHRSLPALRDWLRTHARTSRPAQLPLSRLRPKTSSPTRLQLFGRTKGNDVERKENTYVGAKSDVKRPDNPIKTASRSRFLDNEPKPKSLTAKKRNILAIRKPNTSKSRIDVKNKTKRSNEELKEKSMSTKLSKKSFVRGSRIISGKVRPSSSSDDMVATGWEDVGTILGSQSGIPENITLGGAKRRPFPNSSPARLKKIRLKNVI